MYDELLKTFTKIAEFTAKHHCKTVFHLHDVSELQEESENQSSNWKKFEKMGGVYCIYDEACREVRYIGSSMVDTGTRVFKWVFKDVEKITSRGDKILSIVMPDGYLAPALESFLISELKPTLNKKK